ncbi:MAG: zinc ABC transporter substrate-binding protein [Yoonia sp.]|nr:zinc ABC transporter substrate-binding protein [Yoonia sp.]
MRLIAAFAALFASNAAATPIVVTDIAPIHGLVSEVMGDLGSPTLLLPTNADAHHYTMRPSDGQVLADADLVIWVGAGLTPWLEAPLQALAPDAKKLALLLSDGWAPRESHDEDDHDHGVIDPHAWLDPAIANAWLGAIAAALGAVDPENAEAYADNAEQAAVSNVELRLDIAAKMEAVAGRGVIWPHDAYGYFADAFGVMTKGAISDSDAAAPGPAHIAELREIAQSGNVVCVLLDPEVNPSWAGILTDGTDVKTAQIDPIGVNSPLGVGFYSALMSQMADQISGCLAQ